MLTNHPRDKEFMCELCTEVFPTLELFAQHTKIHHSVDSSSTLPVRGDSNVMVNQPTNIETVFLTDNKLLATPIGKQTGEQMSVHVLVNDSVVENNDFDNYHSLLISAALNADMTIEGQTSNRQMYQVMCLNPDTQEVVSGAQEVIVQGQSIENSLVIHKDTSA